MYIYLFIYFIFYCAHYVHYYANIEHSKNLCLEMYPAIEFSKYRVNPLDGRRGLGASFVLP